MKRRTVAINTAGQCLCMKTPCPHTPLSIIDTEEKFDKLKAEMAATAAKFALMPKKKPTAYDNPPFQADDETWEKLIEQAGKPTEEND